MANIAFGFVGTPDQIVEQMQSFIRLGVTTFLVDCGGSPNFATLKLLIKNVPPTQE